MTVDAETPHRDPLDGPSRSRHRRILALAIPAIGTLVADPLLGVVDTAVAGRIGPTALGALGLSVAALSALTWIFNFLVFGTTTAVAQAVGRGEGDEAGAHIAHAAAVALALGVATGGALFVAAEPLVHVFGAVEELVEPATDYLRVRAVGVPFFLLGYVGHGAFRGVSNTRTPLIVVGIANAVNAGLDVVLVFGLGAGLVGVAWATVAAEILAVLVFAVLLARLGLPLTGHGLPDRARLRELFTVSRDLFLRTGSLLLGLLVISTAAARISAETAAAHQVLWQVWIVVSFLMDGFAIAGQAMVGTALGRGESAEARAVARDLLVWGLGGGVLVGVGLLALGGVVPRLLTDDAGTLDLVAKAWWLATLGHILNGVVFVLDGVLMGADDFAYLRRWTMVASLLGGGAAYLAVAVGAGILGLWIAVEVLMLARLASLLLRVRRPGWARGRASV